MSSIDNRIRARSEANETFHKVEPTPRFLSWDQFKSLCDELSKKIDWQKYVAIYPILRGGLYPAVELSRISGLPIVWELCDGALIVDEICDSGATLRTFCEQDRDTAVLHYKGRIPTPTYYVCQTNEWIVYPWETAKDVESIVSRQIEYIGDNPARKGLAKTPKRVVESWKEIYSGYSDDPAEILSSLIKFDRQIAPPSPIILRDVKFFSMDESTLMPFWGEVTIGYLPESVTAGSDDLLRLVQCFSRRMQTQERMCEQIVDAIDVYLRPSGVYVESRARRLEPTASESGRFESTKTTYGARGDFKPIQERLQQNA